MPHLVPEGSGSSRKRVASADLDDADRRVRSSGLGEKLHVKSEQASIELSVAFDADSGIERWPTSTQEDQGEDKLTKSEVDVVWIDEDVEHSTLRLQDLQAETIQTLELCSAATLVCPNLLATLKDEIAASNNMVTDVKLTAQLSQIKEFLRQSRSKELLFSLVNYHRFRDWLGSISTQLGFMENVAVTESMHRDGLKVVHETQRIIMDPAWHDSIYGLRGEGANSFLNLLQEIDQDPSVGGTNRR
ncbi:hypothetical protein PUNSTDRAFT_135025 [Punctularia strigosozonata HHB-11173 SS5]|uniref:uncharacterized protein n=1 Tax=Punctularia strigosozonata (strain HHB-11173) TaxID=741275 RepID=UPI00044176EE|nr:uncharacterized protein PUNSTDRAFT_135025 [Punctularia strigosozonata HHB-11173 SS5]EIN08647.1 hypothetical protein PUNSTDRAFT_135025 [Punctularia strigosozonata HHB-11173 SS5]